MAGSQALTSSRSTAAHSMDITYEGLYERMVASSAGGSYCFGLNGLFFQMIKALGFRCSVPHAAFDFLSYK